MRLQKGLLLAAAVALPWTAHAQTAPAGSFTVTPRGGYLLFPEATGIDNAPFIGVEASYNFSPMFSLGTALTVARPQTRAEQFVTQLAFGDTTFYYAVEQPITLVDAGLTGTLKYPGERLSPFVTGGVGVYTLDLDPQVVGGDERVSKLSGMIGAGINYRVGRTVGIQLAARDLIFTNYDRDRLNPIRNAFTNSRYVEDFTPPPAGKSTAHNIMVSLGFSFIPGAAAIADVQGEGSR